MPFVLPDLPYAKDALEPYISKETLEFHYGKHHQAYLNNLNLLTEGKPESSKSLEEVILSSDGPLFNNAAQVWNHTFYWKGLNPYGGEPSGIMLDAIKEAFGSVAGFKEEMTNAATTQFGSGWAWLVLDAGRLKVTKSSNADLPMKHGQIALWTIDVWEHAYYVDYRNVRPKYVESVLNHLINWDFVATNYTKR